MPKLAFDHPKRLLHLGADAGLDLLELVLQRVTGSRFVQRPALTRHHGNLPIHIGVRARNFFTLLPAVARVGKDHIFLPVKQTRHIVRIRGRRRDGVHQARLGIYTDMRLHPKVPLAASLREAMNEVIDWLNFFNHARLHSTLGYVSSMTFEQHWIAAQQQDRKSA